MEPPSPALLIYLFSDTFLPSTGGFLSRAALAPRTGDRLDLTRLVTRLYSAVIMELVYQDALRLVPGEVKKFLGTETALLAEARPAAAGFSKVNLAGQMAGRLIPGGEPAQNRVRELLTRQVGGRGSTATPWEDALAPFILEAVRCGYVTLPEETPTILSRLFNPAEARTRVVPVLDQINRLQSEAVVANGRLDQFLAFQGEAGEMLGKEIESGIRACQRSKD